MGANWGGILAGKRTDSEARSVGLHRRLHTPVASVHSPSHQPWLRYVVVFTAVGEFDGLSPDMHETVLRLGLGALAEGLVPEPPVPRIQLDATRIKEYRGHARHILQ